MSTFKRQTKHPKTGEWEHATWYDDFFGSHRYGVQFPSDKVEGVPFKAQLIYDPDEIKLETKDNDVNKECCPNCWGRTSWSASQCIRPSCKCHNPKESESWEKPFRNKWEGANVVEKGDYLGVSLSTMATNEMVRDITSLLKRQKETVYDEIEGLIEQEKKDYTKYIGKSASIIPVLSNLLTQIQAKRDNNGTIPN